MSFSFPTFSFQVAETTIKAREAIDMVISGKWEPDRESDRPDPRRRYETYSSQVETRFAEAHPFASQPDIE